MKDEGRDHRVIWTPKSSSSRSTLGFLSYLCSAGHGEYLYEIFNTSVGDACPAGFDGAHRPSLLFHDAIAEAGHTIEFDHAGASEVKLAVLEVGSQRPHMRVFP